MILDLTHKILAVLSAVLIIGAAVLLYFWIQSRGDAIRAQAFSDGQQRANEKSQEEVKTLQQQLKALSEADGKRAEEQQKTIEAMRVSIAKLSTPQQIAQWLPSQIATPQPIHIEVPSSTPANPNPVATVTFPASDLAAIRDQIESCKECKVNLGAAQQTIESKQKAVANLTHQVEEVTEQRDAAQREEEAWRKAAKGGSFLQRVKKAAIHMAIGGGITAIAVCGTGHCQ